MVFMSLFARKEWRYRGRELFRGLSGGRIGWDDWKKKHWHMYAVICEIDGFWEAAL